MSKNATLKQLEDLFNIPEVKGGFPSQQACISWANRVAPLLKFNPDYYQVFMHYSQIINHNISTYTAEPAFRNMVSQVEMAIQELRIDTADNDVEPTQETKQQERQANGADLVDLKPNFFGLGVNLNEGWRRIRGWLQAGKKSKP